MANVNTRAGQYTVLVLGILRADLLETEDSVEPCVTL